jgi:outer membrane protein assembly factor BamA
MNPTYDYGSVFADIRTYTGITKRHNFALRLVGASSFGPDARAATYWVGGSQTIRGYSDYEFHGTQIAFLNAEFRYPFVDRLKLGFPLPLDFRSVRGALFVDAGGATDDWSTFRVSESTDEGYFKLRDLKVGFGVGVRMNISFLVMKLDAAKSTDFYDISRDTRWYFTLGSEF